MACGGERHQSAPKCIKISTGKPPCSLFLFLCTFWSHFIGTTIRNPLKLPITLQFLLFLLHINGIHSEGHVGCHYVKTLCVEGKEVCYNDNIFGKCIPTTGVDMEEIDKTPLSEEQTRVLVRLLEELQGVGLGWNNPYVQCRIQGAIYSIRKLTPLPPHLCSNLAPSDDYFAIPNLGNSAPLFLTDTVDNGNGIYYAPFKKQSVTNYDRKTIADKIMNFNSPLESQFSDFSNYADGRFVNPKMQYQPQGSEGYPNEFQINDEDENKKYKILQEQLGLYENNRLQSPLDTIEMALDNYRLIPTEDNYGMETMGRSPLRAYDLVNLKGRKIIPSQNAFQEANIEVNPSDSQSPTFDHFDNSNSMEMESLLAQKRFTMENNGNEPFLYNSNPLRNSLKPYEEDAILASNSYANNKEPLQQDGVYTEGGGIVSILKNENLDRADRIRDAKARDLLANMLGFTRHERLDVKKPGPQIGPPSSLSSLELKPKIFNKTKEMLPTQMELNNETKKRKKLVKGHSEDDHAPHSIDTQYAYVKLKNPIDNWSDGVRIMNELANVLHMQGYFNYLTVQPYEVSFRVESNNPERKTATDVARAINENPGLRNNILRRIGVTVGVAGVGDQTKESTHIGVTAARIELPEQSADVTHILAYMFAGAGAAAIIVIFVTLILIKRHDKKRDKLGGIQSGIATADSCSKDYQDLCRARMNAKANTNETVTASGRITSLSKENEKPPSSRSSTSSWSEEPALTNMDISTGHMVLSYMEDHLRNKGRLQREWEGLCRYEAEPSAREAALQPQCAQLNRQGAPLPYDHSRVVLNHLANADGLDYINASTITDHDPRAPAYVAAQGPLPTTLAHFWQMIWEQGAVVIVSLCRLQENGEIACARYWPEEGAEVYHIYEVHLVSEHIWCDDYLVRSFYLKNLRTSETRTVTQFHFLSWPQNGVPAQAKPLLDFRRKVNKSYRGRSCPIVVHGCNGAGRTGAYILLDMVLGRMNKGAREIDIAATLEHLRDQRAGLVATRQQFEFVLMAVAEEVHAILKALPANPPNEKRDIDTCSTGKPDSEDIPTPSVSNKKGIGKDDKMTVCEKSGEKEEEQNKNEKPVKSVGKNEKKK